MTCDETSSSCQEVGEGLGAFCLCKNGYHYPIMVLDGAVLGEADTLETSTKQCFPIDECTGRILGQINPNTNELGLVPKVTCLYPIKIRFLFSDSFGTY